MNFVHIVAADSNLLIGNSNKLPWNIPEDMSYFSNITQNKILIMGRKTYESIPKALKNRTVIVLSKDKNFSSKKEKIIVKTSLEEAISYCKQNHNNEEIFIAGGREIFIQTIPIISKIYFTQIKETFQGNTYYPPIDLKKFKLTKITPGNKCDFLIYQKN